MKKQVIFILCCLFALSTGTVIANSNHVTETSVSVMSYVIDFGDISELNAEISEAMANEASAMGSSAAMICSYEITITIKIDGQEIKLEVTYEGACNKGIESAMKLLALIFEDLF